MPTFPMSIIQLVVKILGKGDIDWRFVDHTGEDQGRGITTSAHVPANFPLPGIHFRMYEHHISWRSIKVHLDEGGIGDKGVI
jgi:hypothetical protein